MWAYFLMCGFISSAGEALVGNEAVDQLVKFNAALADHSSQNNPHLIDGIVLTKFDTIDDKVRAGVNFPGTELISRPFIPWIVSFPARSELISRHFILFLQVGSAISMTYITGQPIIFVGTGQTYTDLKRLNPKAVVQSLMK